MKPLLKHFMPAIAFIAVCSSHAFAELTERDFDSPKVAANMRKHLLMSQVRSFLEDSETMTLDDALSDAMAQSTELKTATLKLGNMIENLRQVRSHYYPDFRIELSPAYQQINQENRSPEDYSKSALQGALKLDEHLPGNIDIAASVSRGISFTGRQTDHMRFAISREFLQKDPVKRDYALAGFKVDLEKVATGQIRRNFTYEFKSAYYAYLEAWLGYLNARVKFDADKHLNQESQNKYGAGIIAQYQLLDYDRDFTESQIAMSTMKLAWVTARNQLLYLLQRPLDDTVQFHPIPEGAISERVWNAELMLESSMKSALNVASLNYALLSNRENLNYYRSKLLPSLSAFSSVDHNLTGTYTEDEDDLVDERTATSYAVGLKLVLPLFQSRFMDRSKMHVFNSNIEINELELKEQFRFYQRQVANDLLTLRNLHERYVLEKKRFHISFADYELGKLRFENGSIGSYDMIRSKNQFFRSNARCIAMQYQLLRKIAKMEQSYPLIKVENHDDE